MVKKNGIYSSKINVKENGDDQMAENAKNWHRKGRTPGPFASVQLPRAHYACHRAVSSFFDEFVRANTVLRPIASNFEFWEPYSFISSLVLSSRVISVSEDFSF